MTSNSERYQGELVLADSDERLRGISDIAMACFLEVISPNELPLSRERLDEVNAQLSRLQQESPLVAYTYCLRRLSASGVSEEDA